ncbi:MAG: DUF6090 family protein [Maribacter sp.]|nr:DUF6090 family protein [Maribacter sp.]
MLYEGPPSGQAGKTNNYLKYAIGEIILVVIGILIALQINNWNTSRIEKNEETQILKNLKAEFQDAVEQLIYLDAIRSDFLSVTDGILKISNEDKPYDNKKIDSLMMFTFYSPTFNDPVGSLQSLISSNRIDLIRNNVLKVRLMAWPSECNDMTEGEIIENNITVNQYCPLLFEHISVANVLKNFRISDLNFNRQSKSRGLTPSKFITSNYLSLFKDVRFINTLHMRANLLNISKHESELLIEKAKEIIKLIDADLL